MRRVAALPFLLYLLFPGPVAANDSLVWLIGGGPNVFKSQVQIERNLLWVHGAIEKLDGKRNVQVFFTDRDATAPDIHEWSSPPEDAASLQPLALVFDSSWSNGLEFRNHRIPSVAGSTEKRHLVSTLGAQFRALRPGDEGWLLFLGHGAFHKDLNNGLELWKDTELKVSELGELMDQAPRKSQIRFLLAQCYSGAFAKLAAPGSNRCGFMAAPATHVSEGCSPAVEKKDYEDYSTFFFAALTGLPRDGSGLDGRPDWDSDGRVTPLEAHFHVLGTAFSADIPRSTSEALLMEWKTEEALDLLADTPENRNEYTELARALMRDIGIDPDAAPGQAMYRRQRRLETQWEQLEQAQQGLNLEIASLQEGIRTELLRRWPRAASPYTLGFKRFLAHDLAAAQAFIEAHPDYPALVRKQARFWTQDEQALLLRREQNQLNKIAHLLRLGKLKTAMIQDGPKELQERYQTLRECESAPF